jgi:hypothetical protein
MVVWLTPFRQPLPIQQQLTKTDFRIDIFMSNPLLDDLNSLSFTRDGRPIPPRVVELRKMGVKQQRTKRLGDVLLRHMAEALSKQSATLGDDPWALEWLLRGVKHFGDRRERARAGEIPRTARLVFDGPGPGLVTRS